MQKNTIYGNDEIGWIGGGKPVLIELTLAQGLKLDYILSLTYDLGPECGGWASEELEELRKIVKSSVLLT